MSHAVGCAFAICLERKQKRDKDSSTGVQVTYSQDKTSFTRMGSFRQTTLTERITDPQSAILAGKKKSRVDREKSHFTILVISAFASQLTERVTSVVKTQHYNCFSEWINCKPFAIHVYAFYTSYITITKLSGKKLRNSKFVHPYIVDELFVLSKIQKNSKVGCLSLLKEI